MTSTGQRPDRSRGSLYEELRDRIASGDLAPGDHLVETTLAKHHGVSRTPIREALRRLEQDGLVEQFERGLRVRLQDLDEILEVYGVRILLEGAVAASAAERYRESDRLRLHSLLERMDNVEPGDVDAMAEANRHFHQAVWAAGHNQTLVDMLNRLSVRVDRYSPSTYSDVGRWPRAAAQHHELYQAIVGRDAEAARTVAGTHMQEARDVRVALWQSAHEAAG
ncbi:MAG TPA: GntR family transcriptional regulator [Actinomycetales bacterium]|nr:GntR family transcriptional regulator [Actinomycetales bacterium]